MKIIRQQNFNVEFFEIEHEKRFYRVGVGNYKENQPGCEMFFPEAGSEYCLVVFDNGWYKFELKEFTHTAGISYIAEKLKCSEKEASIIREFISGLLISDAALNALNNDNNNWHVRNPYLL